MEESEQESKRESETKKQQNKDEINKHVKPVIKIYPEITELQNFYCRSRSRSKT